MDIAGSLGGFDDVSTLLGFGLSVPGQEENFVNPLDCRVDRFGLIEITDDYLYAHILQRLGFRLVPHKRADVNARFSQCRNQS